LSDVPKPRRLTFVGRWLIATLATFLIAAGIVGGFVGHQCGLGFFYQVVAFSALTGGLGFLLAGVVVAFVTAGWPIWSLRGSLSVLGAAGLVFVFGFGIAALSRTVHPAGVLTGPARCAPP
jgi:hypothetical protein